MRQVPIEIFKRNMANEIKDMPFTVTRRGKVLFVVNHMVKVDKKVKVKSNHVVKKRSDDYFRPDPKPSQGGKK